MYPIGLKSVWIGASTLKKLDWKTIPFDMPKKELNEVVVCGMEGLGDELLMVCEDLSDIRSVFDSENPAIRWYIGTHPTKLLVEDVILNLPNNTDGEISDLVCQCMSFNCGKSILIPTTENLSIVASGLVPIVDGCETGPEASDTLVEKRTGYSLYRE